jgi:starch synthase
MKIAMVASESLPFSKTGGLGDVVFSLSREFVKEKHEVSIILPYYEFIDYSNFPKLTLFKSLDVSINRRKPSCDVYVASYEGITYYLIANKYYFGRDNYYGFFDDGERFAFFTNAVIELLRNIDVNFDVVHVHDRQPGMIPCLLHEKYRKDPKLNDIKTVLTIHNPLFKGYFSKDSLFDFYGLDSSLYDDGSVRLDDQVSTLKAGIKFSDKITTVSPTHAYELTTPEGSMGLWYDMTLRSHDFVGILNGINYEEYDPRKDPDIAKNYDLKTFKSGKRSCKVALCKKLNLNPDLPLFSVISRLADQKGLDLLFAMADFLSYTGGNIVVLGSGEQYAEDYFKGLEHRNPRHVVAKIGFDEVFAHELYAASDFFLMPSKFEPCGIGQMIAQHYGTIPIVRLTGGLKDSVLPYNGEAEADDTFADGFAFSEYNVSEAIKVVGEAINLYIKEPDIIDRLAKNAMQVDHSWKSSAKKYIELYESIGK